MDYKELQKFDEFKDYSIEELELANKASEKIFKNGIDKTVPELWLASGAKETPKSLMDRFIRLGRTL